MTTTRDDEAILSGDAPPARVRGVRTLPWLLAVGGLIGFLASFDLVVERIHLLRDPSYVPSCSINPVLSCGSVMTTDQASVFGFTNPLLGVAGFAAVVAIGMALLAGASLRSWFWWGLLAGEAFGVVFVHWLAFQSLYSIGALCPYCMVVWVVTLPIFLYTLLHAATAGHLGLSPQARRRVSALGDYHAAVLIAWYGLFVVLIALRFWDQWLAMLGIA